jgi:1-acyl-sn-glycerol-3-phosphate acyltransferase
MTYTVAMTNHDKPPVDAMHIAEVYNFYKDNPVNQPFMKFAHYVLGKAMHSEISYWNENGSEYIGEAIEEGKGIVFAANHRTNNDQYVLAALPAQIKELRPMQGTTFIPSKTNLFQNKPLRWAVEQLGAIPAYRAKDFSESQSNLRRIAADDLIDVSVHRVTNGQHLAIFPEGTRNSEQPNEIQKLHRGIAEIICRAQVERDFLVLPIGIAYGEDKARGSKLSQTLISPGLRLRNAWAPNVHIGQPLETPFTSTEDVTSQLRDSLQDSVHAAIERRSVRFQ